MKQTLLNKFLKGETSADEERELKRLLADVPQSELTPEETSVLQILSYSADGEEEDIFAVDYTDEYNKVAHPSRIVHLWPWLAAACVIGFAILLLAPPKGDSAPEQGGGIQTAKVQPDTTTMKETPAVIDIPQQAQPTPQLIAKREKTEKKKQSQPVSENIESPYEQRFEPVAEPITEQIVPETPIEIAEAKTEDNQIAEEDTVRPRLLPISNPERLEYTAEDIEKLKQRAREKYLEWIQLEQEILDADIRHTAEVINNSRKK